MKKVTALITTAILGLSSAAIAKPAAPTQVADAQHDRDRFDDHGRYDHDRYDRDRDHNRYGSRWLDLGVARAGKTTIQLDNRDRYRSLKLDVNGWMRVTQVLVRFADGTERLIKLQKANVSRHEPLVIDLGSSRRLNSVIVYASRYGRGSIEVSGLQTRGRFGRG